MRSHARDQASKVSKPTCGQTILAAVCLLIVLGHGVRSQDASVNKSPMPAQSQPPPPPQQQKQQKPKPARIHPSPKQQPSVARAPAKDRTNAGDLKGGNQIRLSYSDALRRYRHDRHDPDWWKQHFTVIVLVRGGYYYWDAGYWCPAWGYNPAYEYYDYDGPIYTYGNLLPDQVILNVQRALQQLGYYGGGLNGSLNATTRQAIANYQRDAGLIVTGAIDAATVESLGLQ